MVQGIVRAMEFRPRPTAIVVVTDGYTPWPMERTRIPIVACLVGSGAENCVSQVPDWITAVVASDD